MDYLGLRSYFTVLIHLWVSLVLMNIAGMTGCRSVKECTTTTSIYSGYGHLLAECGLNVTGEYLRPEVRARFLQLYAPDNEVSFTRDV